MDVYPPEVYLDNKQLPFKSCKKIILKSWVLGISSEENLQLLLPPGANQFACESWWASCLLLAAKEAALWIALKKITFFHVKTGLLGLPLAQQSCFCPLPPLPILFCVKQDPLYGGEKIHSDESTPLGSDLFCWFFFFLCSFINTHVGAQL